MYMYVIKFEFVCTIYFLYTLRFAHVLMKSLTDAVKGVFEYIECKTLDKTYSKKLVLRLISTTGHSEACDSQH